MLGATSLLYQENGAGYLCLVLLVYYAKRILILGATSLLCQKNGAEYLCLVLLVHLKKRQELNTYICSVLVVFKSAKSLLGHEFTSLLGNGSTMSLLVY